VSRLRTGRQGFVLAGAETFRHSVRTELGAHSCSSTLDSRGYFWVVNWTDCEADRSHPYNVHVKNT